MGVRQKDIALIVSIALNVFLVGAAITIYALRETSAHATAGQRWSMRAAASSLDEAHKAAFLRLLHAQGQTVQTQTRSARTIRDEAWDSLGAGTFDAADTKRRLAQARDLNVAARRTVEDAVVDFATGLSPAERASFSHAMRRAASRQHTDTAKGRAGAS